METNLSLHEKIKDFVQISVETNSSIAKKNTKTNQKNEVQNGIKNIGNIQIKEINNIF